MTASLPKRLVMKDSVSPTTLSTAASGCGGNLTHLSDWVSGEIIEIEDNPYRGTVISAKDDMGRIFWGEADYFSLAIY